MKPPAGYARLLPDNSMLSLDMKDQELEYLLQQIANDASLDDTSADEIADSPALWWSVQRNIRNATPAKAPWLPKVLRRFLMIGVPVAAAVVIGAFVYTTVFKTPFQDTATNKGTASLPGTGTSAETSKLPGYTEPVPVVAPLKPSTGSATKIIQAVHKVHSTPLPQTLMAQKLVKGLTEIKSDFIALAYARNPESGQLVRVKVPSSMMVSLGVVPTVDDPSKLIDAEVLVGDDGLTHAIRFIRQ
ncbi:MAG TPA: hypothetical protein VGI80_06965 [Pyrinomonadaceae bacterium]